MLECMKSFKLSEYLKNFETFNLNAIMLKKNHFRKILFKKSYKRFIIYMFFFFCYKSHTKYLALKTNSCSLFVDMISFQQT